MARPAPDSFADLADRLLPGVVNIATSQTLKAPPPQEMPQLPPGPGLGVEVDEKALVEEASKPQTYKWPGQKLKDGSVADY